MCQFVVVYSLLTLLFHLTVISSISCVYSYKDYNISEHTTTAENTLGSYYKVCAFLPLATHSSITVILKVPHSLLSSIPP